MAGWGQQHAIRIATQKAEIEDRIASINELMLYLPPRFCLVTDATGRNLTIVEIDEQPKETKTDGLQAE